MALELENDDTDSDAYDPKLNIYQRIQRVKQAVSGVDKKGKHAQGFAFLKHDDVTAALSGLFVKFGIDRAVDVERVEQRENILDMWVLVSWVNVDDPDDRKTVRMYAEGVNIIRQNGGVNRDGLASGKALSYAVKMAELKNFCLVGDTTPDAERSGGSFGGSFDSAQQVAAPTDDEYKQLCQLYKDCPTFEEFQAIRKMVTPLVHQGKLSKEQGAELSRLDNEANVRLKGKK